MASTRQPARPATPAVPGQPPKPQGKPMSAANAANANNGAARPQAAPAARPAPRPQGRPVQQQGQPSQPQGRPMQQQARPQQPRQAPRQLPPPAPVQGQTYDDVQDPPNGPEPHWGDDAAPAYPAPRPQGAVRPTARPAAPAPLVEQEFGIEALDAPTADYMREDAQEGTVDIPTGQMGIVQFKLMQSNSPELLERDDLRAGDFLHTGSGRNYGPKTQVVVVWFQHQEMLWRPRGMGGGLLAAARDGKHWDPPNAEFAVTLDPKDGGATVTWRTAETVAESGLTAWGSSDPNNPNSKPASNTMHNYVVVPWPDMNDGPAILTLQRSGLKFSREVWTRKMQLLERKYGIPLYAVIYTLWSVPAQNKNGQPYLAVRSDAAGKVHRDDRDIYDTLKAWHAQFAEKGAVVANEHELEDAAGVPDEDRYDSTSDTQQYEGGTGPAY